MRTQDSTKILEDQLTKKGKDTTKLSPCLPGQKFGMGEISQLQNAGEVCISTIDCYKSLQDACDANNSAKVSFVCGEMDCTTRSFTAMPSNPITLPTTTINSIRGLAKYYMEHWNDMKCPEGMKAHYSSKNTVNCYKDTTIPAIPNNILHKLVNEVKHYIEHWNDMTCPEGMKAHYSSRNTVDCYKESGDIISWGSILEEAAIYTGCLIGTLLTTTVIMHYYHH